MLKLRGLKHEKIPIRESSNSDWSSDREDEKIPIRESSSSDRFVRTSRSRRSSSGDLLVCFLCDRNRFLVIGNRSRKPEHFKNIAFGKDNLEIALPAGHCVRSLV